MTLGENSKHSFPQPKGPLLFLFLQRDWEVGNPLELSQPLAARTLSDWGRGGAGTEIICVKPWSVRIRRLEKESTVREGKYHGDILVSLRGNY